jgi:5-formyltetrahydrofolate cyclo-ligase
MSLESMTNKEAWRQKFRAGLKTITPSQRQKDSAAALRLLRQQMLWPRAGAILFYAPTSLEIDLTPLIEEALQAGKAVALPRFVGETGTYHAVSISDFKGDCGPGKFGIAEPGAHCQPISLKRLDLALVPGLGFDVSGGRLGRGQGFYDRLLADIACAKCGVAFDRQIVEQLPAAGHDVSMNFILTPTRWLEISTPMCA